MARPPFDPNRIAHPPESSRPTAAGRRQRPLTVSEVAVLIREALADAAPQKIHVVGEVSNFSDRAHWFFSLKDEQATLRCVLFASAARKVRVPMSDGLQVVATGRLDFYDAQGHVQLYVEKIEPVGQGELELRFRALCEELRKAGYFDPETKLPLPAVPLRIAVVTSRSAAALQDVINTTRQRWPGCRLLLYDVRVQGDQAAPQIAAAITSLVRHGPQLDIDAVILTRGGGSIEDLWAFNERIVADAIHASTLPIVAAIGHETDTTIAELVADVRCATPTQAAMTLVPDAQALAQQVRQYGQRMALMLRRQAEHGRQRLDGAARHPVFRRPQALVDTARDGLERHEAGLARALRDRLLRARERLTEHQHALDALEPRGRLALAQRRTEEGAARLVRAAELLLNEKQLTLRALRRQLDAVGPGSVLGRGYSYTLGIDGRPLRSVDQVDQGHRITTVLSDGRFKSTVDDSALGQRSSGREKPSRSVEQCRKATTPARTKQGHIGQLDLFAGESL